MILSLLWFAIIMATLYISMELTQKPIHALFFKALASMSFILLGLGRFLLTQSFFPMATGFIIMGLVAGLVGDLILALRPLRPKSEDKQIIVYGIIAFSIGHLMYLVALNTILSIGMIPFIIGFGVMIIVIIMSKFMRFEMGIARIPSYFYAFLIFTFVGQTLMIVLGTPGEVNYVYFLMGALLFGISDLILAPIYYANQQGKLYIALNLVTYYAAQILIAFGLFYL